MKKAFLFLALCLLGAGRAAAAEPADSVRNVIYMIGDGMGLSQISIRDQRRYPDLPGTDGIRERNTEDSGTEQRL